MVLKSYFHNVDFYSYIKPHHKTYQTDLLGHPIETKTKGGNVIRAQYVCVSNTWKFAKWHDVLRLLPCWTVTTRCYFPYLVLELLGGEKPIAGKHILDYFSLIWQF